MNGQMQIRREDIDFRILRLLGDEPTLSQRELAGRVGVSVGQLNYCLHALVGKGCIKIKNFRNNDNKLAYAYLLTPWGVTEKANMAVRFLQRKMVEYEDIKREIASLQSELPENRRKMGRHGYR